MAAGLTSVASLVKDGDGIWRGSAMKDGKAVKVAVDFKGNVVTEITHISKGTPIMKTIARVYDTYGQARQVVADLEDAGIATSDINLIANKYVCDETAGVHEPSAAGPGAGVGAALGGTAGLLAGLGIIAIPGLGPVVAAGALARHRGRRGRRCGDRRRGRRAGERRRAGGRRRRSTARPCAAAARW